jgi:hypothetical protein
MIFRISKEVYEAPTQRLVDLDGVKTFRSSGREPISDVRLISDIPNSSGLRAGISGLLPKGKGLSIPVVNTHVRSQLFGFG